jgi:hypothetical protein
MKRSWNNFLKLAAMALALGLILTSLLLNGAGRRAQAASAQTQSDPDPSTNDLTLNPPRVESMTTTPLAAPTADGNALLLVRFAPDARLGPQVKTVIDDRDVLLSDDGTGGNETAGDGTYSAVVALDFAALADNQDRVQAINAEPEPSPTPVESAPQAATASDDTSAQVVTMPSFDARTEAGVTQVPLVDFRNVKPGQIVPLNPIGTARAVDPERSLMIRDVRVVARARRWAVGRSGT